MMANVRKTTLPLIGISRTRAVMIGAAVLLGAAFYWQRLTPAPSAAADAPKTPPAIPVETALTQRADVPVYLEGLGTVQAFYTVKVTPRVDGQLQKIGFVEGQTVQKGAFLAQIDPRPFRAALEQAIATKDKDAAQLVNAERDLDRYKMLAPDDLVSRQTLDTQRALVAQIKAQLEGDQAAIDSARTQLGYTTITSPIRGRTGIRQVDPGNVVHASDTAGIVVITQMQPISVIFALPEDDLSAVSAAMARGAVKVVALPQDGETELDRGTIALIDNQIDQATGTIRLKATFPNPHDRLWPGQFVNMRTLLKTERNALTIPSAAVERGPDGVFAYVVRPDSTVDAQLITIGEESGTSVVVKSGLQDGARVVTSNQYRLQPNARVRVVTAAARKSPAAARKGSR
jgi:membrane fusion protein, multidrug efflux system